MLFLYPSFLFALAFLAIPIIIHLFNFRRYKKFVFSDIRFLKQLTEQNKRQQSIKKWLVLLCRLLALSFLVLAFARPFVPLHKNQMHYRSKVVSIYVDNSFSMQAVNKEGPLLDQAKAKAAQIAGMYADADQFQLLTNDFEGRHQRLVTKKDFLQMLQEVESSPVHHTLSEVYQRQLQLFGADQAAQKNMYWLSDFQQNMDDHRKISEDTTINLRLIPLNAAAGQNVWIDSVWLKEPFIRTGAPGELQVLIRNRSEEAIENQPLVFRIDGVQKGIRNYSCAANSKTQVSMNLTLYDSNWHDASLSITDYPLVADDIYHLALKAQPHVSVLFLKEGETDLAFSKVYALDKFYQLNTSDMRQINYAGFNQSSLIILNEPAGISSGLALELNRFIDNGGVVLLIPSSSASSLSSVNNFLGEAAGIQLGQLVKQQSKLVAPDVHDELFQQVFNKIPEQANLPVVNEYWQLQVRPRTAVRTTIALNNDLPYLLHGRRKKGSLYVAASSFSKSATNLTQHALFVPMLLRLPLLSADNYPLSFTLGKQSSFQFANPGGDKLLKLSLGKQEYLLEARSHDGKWEAQLNGQIKTAGVYSLKDQNGSPVARVAFNYNRNESDPALSDVEELAKALHASKLSEDIAFFSKKLSLEENGVQYWRMALWLSLFFIVAELLILRFWK